MNMIRNIRMRTYENNKKFFHKNKAYYDVSIISYFLQTFNVKGSNKSKFSKINMEY